MSPSWVTVHNSHPDAAQLGGYRHEIFQEFSSPQTVLMVEAARQQRHYKDNLSHAEIMYGLNAGVRPNIRTVTRPIEITLAQQGQNKGWNDVMAEVNALSTTLRSVEDLKKLAMSSFIFLLINI